VAMAVEGHDQQRPGAIPSEAFSPDHTVALRSF
jgi:hypothetical protein